MSLPIINPSLFINGNVGEPIYPHEGMIIADADYRESGIKLWINQVCFQREKACQVSHESSSKRKVFICTDKNCGWKLTMYRGTQKKIGW